MYSVLSEELVEKKAGLNKEQPFLEGVKLGGAVGGRYPLCMLSSLPSEGALGDLSEAKPPWVSKESRITEDSQRNGIS